MKLFTAIIFAFVLAPTFGLSDTESDPKLVFPFRNDELRWRLDFIGGPVISEQMRSFFRDPPANTLEILQAGLKDDESFAAAHVMLSQMTGLRIPSGVGRNDNGLKATVWAEDRIDFAPSQRGRLQREWHAVLEGVEFGTPESPWPYTRFRAPNECLEWTAIDRPPRMVGELKLASNNDPPVSREKLLFEFRESGRFAACHLFLAASEGVPLAKASDGTFAGLRVEFENDDPEKPVYDFAQAEGLRNLWDRWLAMDEDHRRAVRLAMSVENMGFADAVRLRGPDEAKAEP